jgi:leader peptidase (prepilin peptidase) / N-methyltransferase
LATGLAFALIFYLDVIAPWHRMPFLNNAYLLRVQGVPEWQLLVVFGHHAVLFSFLLAASLCDWDQKAIPLSLTTTGTLVGLISATLFPWPWPNDPSLVAEFRQRVVGPLGVRDRMWTIDVDPTKFPQGLYPWPVFGPLPDWLWNHGWAHGLLTGLAGAAAGMILLRVIKFMFERALNMEAMGLGDADLMMLGGAFLGWQPIIVAFFVGAVAAIPLGLTWRIVKGEKHFPFGPGLALGILVTAFAWPWLGPGVYVFFFDGLLIAIAAGLLLGGLFLGSVLLKVMGFGAPPPGGT